MKKRRVKPNIKRPVRTNADPPESSLRPRWDAELRELWLGDILVKRFKRVAAMQAAILSAFQEEGWPTKIFSPLSPAGPRSQHQRLRETVANLNEHMENPLLHFHSDGSGESVCWRLT